MDDDDDDHTVFQTEEERRKLEKELLSGQYEDDTDYDTTIQDTYKGRVFQPGTSPGGSRVNHVS